MWQVCRFLQQHLIFFSRCGLFMCCWIIHERACWPNTNRLTTPHPRPVSDHTMWAFKAVIVRPRGNTSHPLEAGTCPHFSGIPLIWWGKCFRRCPRLTLIYLPVWGTIRKKENSTVGKTPAAMNSSEVIRTKIIIVWACYFCLIGSGYLWLSWISFVLFVLES